MTPGGIAVASYIDLVPFPPCFNPNRPFPDYFTPFLDFWSFWGSCWDIFFDKYMGQP